MILIKSKFGVIVQSQGIDELLINIEPRVLFRISLHKIGIF